MKPSRQVKYQQQHMANGLCCLCSEKIWRKGARHCLKHAIQQREYQRKRVRAVKRYRSATLRAEKKSQKFALTHLV